MLEGFILTTIFLVVLFAPPARMALTRKSEVSKAEQRTLAEFPDLELTKESVEQFPDAFKAFVMDHFGFRNLFIRTHNYIKAIWLKKSPASNIIIGKNNWLFYTGDMGGDIIEDFRGLSPFSPLQLEALNDLMKKKKEWLSNQGIEYLFVIVPNKHTIYPEFIPERLNQVSTKRRFTQLVSFVKKHSTDESFLDLQLLLTKNKKQDLVYYKTDSHWNGFGAFLAYRAIIEKISTWFPEISGSPQAGLYSKQTKVSKGSGLAQMLNLAPFYTEEEVNYSLESTCAENLKIHDIEEVLTARPGTISFVKGCDKASLRAIVFRDSFFVPIVPLLSEHFEQIVYVWDYYDRETLKKLIEVVKPDVVIEEHVERFLYTNFNPVSDLNKQGKALLAEGNYSEAVSVFRKALKLNPKHPEMNNTLGYALLKQKKLNKAVFWFKKAIALDPNYRLAIKNLALCMKQLGMIDRELFKVKESLRKNQDDHLLNFKTGQLLQKKGDIKSAVLFYKKVLSIQPDFTPAINRIGFIFAEMGKYPKAAEMFQRSISIKPDNADSYYNLACIYAKLDQPLKSINMLKKAIEKGYNNLDKIKKDRDLESIRATIHYKKLTENFPGAQVSGITSYINTANK